VSRPLYLRHPTSQDHLTGPGHPERPERTAAIERALADHDWLGWEVREAPAAPEGALEAVHAPEHLAAVRAAAETGGAALDPETPVSPGSWRAAVHAAGGACAMAAALLAGEAGTAFCGARPPGHHAHSARSWGFCLLNSVAVAARHALDALGARRVMVIDWDVHHGDGTNEIFRESPDVLYASIHQEGIFPGTGPLLDVGSGAGRGFAINLPVASGTGEDVWLALLEWIVIPAGVEFRPDLVLISAGYDAHRADPLAGCTLETASFGAMARMVRDLGRRVGAPVGAVLEGGYDLDALAGSVVATMEGLADDRPAPTMAPGLSTSRAAAHIGHFWSLTP
jgi:acetoin utilization deacetylase AcuC-like enzyme